MKGEIYSRISAVADEYALNVRQVADVKNGEEEKYILYGFENWNEVQSFLKEEDVQGLRLRPVVAHQDANGNLTLEDDTVQGPFEFSIAKWGGGYSVLKHWEADKESQFLSAYAKPWLEGYLRSADASISGLQTAIINVKEIWDAVVDALPEQCVVVENNNGKTEYYDTVDRYPVEICHDDKLITIAIV